MSSRYTHTQLSRPILIQTTPSGIHDGEISPTRPQQAGGIYTWATSVTHHQDGVADLFCFVDDILAREPETPQESTGEPRRAQESPGEPRRAQESPGEPRRAQESTGEHRRAQESPGEPRSAQGAQESMQQCTGPRRTVCTEHAEHAGERAAGHRDLTESPRRVSESEIFKNDGHGAQARATGASKRTTARRRDTSQIL